MSRNWMNADAHPAWELRYGRDRERYLVRPRDPQLAGPPYFTPLAGTPGRWHEYVGNQIHQDFTMLDGALTSEARYTHAGRHDGALVAIDGGPGYVLTDRRFFHADLLGTTRLLTGVGGTAVSAVSYTAFGQPLGAAPASVPRYGYAGAWGYQSDATDAQGQPLIGMPAAHIGARYYDPSIGRFLARDPIGISGGINVYEYVHSAPAAAVDPTGLEFTTAEVLIADGQLRDLQELRDYVAARQAYYLAEGFTEFQVAYTMQQIEFAIWETFADLMLLGYSGACYLN